MDGFVPTEALPFNETDSESPCDTLKMQDFEGIDIELSMNAHFKQEGKHCVIMVCLFFYSKGFTALSTLKDHLRAKTFLILFHCLLFHL